MIDVAVSVVVWVMVEVCIMVVVPTSLVVTVSVVMVMVVLRFSCVQNKTPAIDSYSSMLCNTESYILA